MSETTPKDHLIILREFLACNKTLGTSSSIRARVNCSCTNGKLHLSCTVASQLPNIGNYQKVEYLSNNLHKKDYTVLIDSILN